MNIRYPIYEGVYRILTFSPTELHENPCRFCGLTAETRTIVPVDGLLFHFPCNYGFPLIFRIVFRRSHHHFPMQR